ncbi:MAG: preprotein translocase subunit TatA [Ignavibacteria bacterium RBG_13_36_8]|nr:MAG: preprotein translocase subunit TatA [Ignavibacteria bacterium RBG_13_36_8]
MFGSLGATEILLIVLAILILFGAKKIPEFAKGIGKGMREFKKALSEAQDEMKVEDNNEKKDENKKA